MGDQKQMMKQIFERIGTTDRSEIGIIGAVWKSKKLGALFLWCGVLVTAAKITGEAGALWEAVALLGLANFNVMIYLWRQSLVDASKETKTTISNVKVNGGSGPISTMAGNKREVAKR